jgi:hypothetical protein
VESFLVSLHDSPLLTFDIPQTALVATLDTYDFLFTLCPLYRPEQGYIVGRKYIKNSQNYVNPRD